MTAPQILVVGNGMVGHRTAEALHARGVTRTHQVLVLGDEPHPAYDRVHLSRALTGDHHDLYLAQDSFYDQPGLARRVGTPVTRLDRPAQEVVLADGSRLRYDALVLATGSHPFVPPISGAQAPHVLVYRTLEDVLALRHAAATARSAVVIGGGLLGLEAAGGLRDLGLTVAVVEVADRLMARQVDEGGGAVLRRLVTDRGVAVHVGGGVASVDTDRVTLTDGSTVTADLVVVAAGIRPRDELAAAAGLELGPRGGVAVDRACRSSDSRIYAVGECASVAGTCYGLVGPGYAMAEVVADRIAGGYATFADADTATELKLLDVPVASFGELGTENAVDLVYADPVGGRYARLSVSDDARTLHGGVLVGDIAPYPLLRALYHSGEPLPPHPEELVLPTRAAGGGAGAAVLPDAATVCACNDVCAGAIRAAVDGGAQTVPALKAATAAGTGCGSCVPLLKAVLNHRLTQAGVAVGTGLCEHFPQSRQELYDLMRVHKLTTFSAVLARLGTGRGCDECKPAIASILATIAPGHALDEHNAALQDTNDHALANLQKDGTYSVVPRLPGGEVTPDALIAIGLVAKDFGLYTKITGGQRVDLFGARLDELPAIWARLIAAGLESGQAYGKALRTVKSCVGQTWCRYGMQDSTSLAIALELRYRGLRAPHKIKGGVSGCARECAEARSKDFGVLATERGWNLYVCGNGGFTPRHAQLLAQDVDTETLTRYLDRFLMFYVRTADRLQRTAPWLEAMEGGIEHLRAVVVDDCLGIADELEADMRRHVETYVDEWREVLADPRKLARFRTFVNAPGVADPNIVTVEERSQRRPAGDDRRPGREVLVAGPALPVGAPGGAG